MVKYLQQKEEKKQAAEEEKIKRKEEREVKKQQREAQKQQRQKEKAVKTRRKNTRQTSCNTSPERRASPVHEEDQDIICPVCHCNSECPGGWVCCDICDIWYHKECTNIPIGEYDTLNDTDWYCPICLAL